MGVTLQRLNPATGAVYGNPITFTPVKSFSRGTTMQNMIQAVPQSKQILVPLGDQGPTVSFAANIHTESTFGEFRKWWPSNWYVKVTSGLGPYDYDMPCGSIWLIDDVRTIRGKAYLDRWDAMMQLTREWDFQASAGTPLPFEPTTPTLRTDGVNGVYLTDADGGAVNLVPYQIEYSMKGQKEIAAIPRGKHIQIPLGVEGPYVTMEAHMRGMYFNVIKDWDNFTEVIINKTAYSEFDVEAGSYYSRWGISNVMFKRAPTQAAEASLANQWWDVSIGLVRWWDREYM